MNALFFRGLILLCLLAALLWAGPALAQDCENAQDTHTMLQCAAASYEKADKELNRVYQQAASKLDETAKEKLKKAQRAWVAFRDAEADLAGDAFRGGTMENVLILSAKADLTLARIRDLKNLLKGY